MNSNITQRNKLIMENKNLEKIQKKLEDVRKRYME